MDNEEIIDIIKNTFDYEDEFLSKIYGISNYDDAINYLKNNENLPSRTKLRILNCLYIIYLEEDYFPSKDYIDQLYITYLSIYNIKLKKSGLKNIMINSKYNKKYTIIIRLIKDNYKNIIEE